MQQLIKEFNRENLKPLVFITVVLLLLAATAYPQRKFGGKVVEVVDGKTAVVQVPTGGKVTVVLQFIEIPEPQQPLYQTVKEHLENLILGKNVEFLPIRVLYAASVGKIFLDGTDISQQMLRDGAAWYALPEKSAQDASESGVYLATEAQAKTEKRGVWSVDDIKPAWEFRADQIELARQAQRAKSEREALELAQAQALAKANTPVKPKIKPALQLDMWSNVSDSAQMNPTSDNGGLLLGSVPNTSISYVMTAGNFYDFASGDVKAKIESRSIYANTNGGQYVNSKGQVVSGAGFIIGFLAESEKISFAESNDLTITADKQKLNLGKALRHSRQMPYTVQEMLIYKTDAKTLARIAAAKNLEVKIGSYAGKLDGDYQLRIKNLLAMTTD